MTTNTNTNTNPTINPTVTEIAKLDRENKYRLEIVLKNPNGAIKDEYKTHSYGQENDKRNYRSIFEIEEDSSLSREAKMVSSYKDLYEWRRLNEFTGKLDEEICKLEEYGTIASVVVVGEKPFNDHGNVELRNHAECICREISGNKLRTSDWETKTILAAMEVYDASFTKGKYWDYPEGNPSPNLYDADNEVLRVLYPNLAMWMITNTEAW